MVKIFANSYVYKHDWSTVTTAFWGKYPNDNAKHVKEVDTYERVFNGITGDLTSKRVLTCSYAGLPSWMTRLGFPSTMHCQEESVVNARDKKLVLRSSNISGSSFIVVEETCVYKPHPENSSWTLYEQEAKISSFTPFFSDSIESHSLQNMKSQASNGIYSLY